MNEVYQRQGYVYFSKMISESAIASIEDAVRAHHACWLKENQAFYATKAINSAYLTRPGFLNFSQRLALFQFIADLAERAVTEQLFDEDICFMNTQLFFNPGNAAQKNYWHRDIQYNDFTESRQKKLLQKLHILHFRIPLSDEPGIELVPGSHARWDTEEERAVRMQLKGSKVHHSLPHTESLRLDRRDLLVFSANMLHRGLYGLDRFALDIIFFSPQPDLQASVQLDNLPDASMMQQLKRTRVFSNSLEFAHNQ